MSANEQLRQDWDLFGRGDGYEAPDEQELRDLADPRNRKRGEKTQRARLKRSRQQLERERRAEQQQVNGTTTHLIGALIGKQFDLSNSAWTGYSGSKSSRCVIDGFHQVNRVCVVCRDRCRVSSVDSSFSLNKCESLSDSRTDVYMASRAA